MSATFMLPVVDCMSSFAKQAHKCNNLIKKTSCKLNMIERTAEFANK